MKRAFYLPVVLCLTCLFSLSICPNAYADCEDLDSNPAWTTGIIDIKKAVRDGKYDNALEMAKRLYGICMESPILYLYTGFAVQKNGEEARAIKYFNKAGELAATKPTNPKDAQLIWYTLYETEHPNSADHVVQEKDAVLKMMTDEVTHEKEENEKLLNLLTNTGGIDIVNSYQNILWTGVGIGSAGLLLTITGSILVGTQSPINEDKLSSEKEIYLKGGYIAGWTLLGIGLGLTLAGAATSGYAGYHLSHMNSGDPDFPELSFHIGPGNASFGIKF